MHATDQELADTWRRLKTEANKYRETCGLGQCIDGQESIAFEKLVKTEKDMRGIEDIMRERGYKCPFEHGRLMPDLVFIHEDRYTAK